MTGFKAQLRAVICQLVTHKTGICCKIAHRLTTASAAHLHTYSLQLWQFIRPTHSKLWQTMLSSVVCLHTHWLEFQWHGHTLTDYSSGDSSVLSCKLGRFIGLVRALRLGRNQSLCLMFDYISWGIIGSNRALSKWKQQKIEYLSFPNVI